MTYTPDDLEADVRLLTQLAADKAALTEVEDTIKARLRAHLSVGATVDLDGRRALTVAPNRRFDVTLAQAVLSPDAIAACTITTVDPAAVKRLLPPALLEACMVEQGAPKIVLNR